MPQYNACSDLESADVAHLTVGSIWVGGGGGGSGRVHPLRERGAHLLLLFSEAPIRADLLWEQGLLRHRAPMQMKSVASRLLDFQAHDATGENNKNKNTGVIYFLQFHGHWRVLLLLQKFKPYSGIFVILWFLWCFAQRGCWISGLASVLNSWQQPAWFTYRTSHKPVQHCKWQWSHRDLSVTLHRLDRWLSKIPVILSANTAQPLPSAPGFFSFFLLCTRRLGLAHSCAAAKEDKDTVSFFKFHVILMGAT